jgi:hypothetical protein
VGPPPATLAGTSAAPAEPLVAVAADAARVPASNAKLLTSTAGYLALAGRYRFVTEVGYCVDGDDDCDPERHPEHRQPGLPGVPP